MLSSHPLAIQCTSRKVMECGAGHGDGDWLIIYQCLWTSVVEIRFVQEINSSHFPFCCIYRFSRHCSGLVVARLLGRLADSDTAQQFKDNLFASSQFVRSCRDGILRLLFAPVMVTMCTSRAAVYVPQNCVHEWPADCPSRRDCPACFFQRFLPFHSSD